MSDEWHRFYEVTKHILTGRRLYRSSAPNYDGHHDKSQRLTKTAVEFLTEHGINSIISFNQYRYTADEIALLDRAQIAYRHLPVEDFQAPTIDQLTQAVDFWRFIRLHRDASTLVHCGYGHGRTGTGVTALQLFTEWGERPVETEWESENHVEKPAQMAVLRQLRKRYKGGGEGKDEL